MPDNVTFVSIPIDVRTPGPYVEVDNSKALRGLPNMQRRMLFIGNKRATGTALQASLIRINSAAQAAALFGRGSVLYEMLAAARLANKETDMWAMPLDDNAGGVAATYTLTVTGPATGAGTIYLYINGRLITVGVASGDAAATIATAIAAAVTAYADGPFSAGAAAAVATLTHRHKGLFGNDADIRINYQPDEALPAGVAIVIAAGAAGTANPNVATALAAIGLESFYDIVMPYNDATNVALVETELASRWGGMDMRAGHLFTGFKGTHSAQTTYGAARNSPHSTVVGIKSAPSPCYVYAAVLAAVAEFSGAIDPARPFQTLPLPGLLAPALADRFTRQERDLLLRDGISTFTVDQGGNVLVERVVTTYQVDAYALEDVSYLDLESKWTADYIRFAFRAAIARAFPRHKLANDGTNFESGQAIATPRLIKSTLLAAFRQMENAGIVEGYDAFAKALVVVRSAADVNRVNAIMPADLVNQFRVFAGSVQFIL